MFRQYASRREFGTVWWWQFDVKLKPVFRQEVDKWNIYCKVMSRTACHRSTLKLGNFAFLHLHDIVFYYRNLWNLFMKLCRVFLITPYIETERCTNTCIHISTNIIMLPVLCNLVVISNVLRRNICSGMNLCLENGNSSTVLRATLFPLEPLKLIPIMCFLTYHHALSFGRSGHH